LISKIIKAGVIFVALASFASGRFSDVKVTFDYNRGSTETKEFKFKIVPSPVKDDAAAKAKLVLVDGEIDPNGADLSALTDGLLPAIDDEPQANFFFNAGTNGGRFVMDLSNIIEIAQINTYSWHSDTRGPQLFKVYASDGTDAKFNGGPKMKIDPTTCGWKFIASVDTRPKNGDGGGQYGVSITDSNGSLGKYRYLLFDCVVAETSDDFGNTFYSEIDVVAKK